MSGTPSVPLALSRPLELSCASLPVSAVTRVSVHRPVFRSNSRPNPTHFPSSFGRPPMPSLRAPFGERVLRVQDKAIGP